MPRSLENVLADFTPEQRARVESDAAQMAEEVMSLREVRQALHLTQRTLAEALDIEQDGVSRIERRTDLLLSTLSSYITAMGGKLKLIAEFPDRPPVQIETFSGLSEQPPPKKRRKLQTA